MFTFIAGSQTISYDENIVIYSFGTVQLTIAVA